MAKPDDMPQALYDEMVRSYEHRTAVDPTRLRQYLAQVEDVRREEPGLVPPEHVDVCLAGWWLWERCRRLGMSQPELEEIGITYGQRLFPPGVKRPDPWAAADTLLADYKSGGDWRPEDREWVKWCKQSRRKDMN